MTFVRLWRILLAGTVEQSNTHRAEVVEGECLGDIVDDSLYCDPLQNMKCKALQNIRCDPLQNMI